MSAERDLGEGLDRVTIRAGLGAAVRWHAPTTRFPILNDDVLATWVQRLVARGSRDAGLDSLATLFERAQAWTVIRQELRRWRRGEPTQVVFGLVLDELLVNLVRQGIVAYHPPLR